MRICGPIWARLGNIIQQPNFAYITQPISRSLPVRDIFPCPVANGIEIKRKTRHAARTASTCFGTSIVRKVRKIHKGGAHVCQSSVNDVYLLFITTAQMVENNAGLGHAWQKRVCLLTVGRGINAKARSR